MPSKNEEFSEISVRKSSSMPRLARDRYKTNKIYRAPPTPPLEKQIDLERSFKLDCVAVSNISLDYSRANPKLGSVIPPYNSLDDKTISVTVKNNGVREFLRRTGQTEHEHDSMAGRVHDFFFQSGTGYKYLSRRNMFGNGHHPEMVDGHQRYMAEQPRVMISYNNMFGYRRNVPKLRTEPPSTFSVDPTYYNHLVKSYGNQYSEDELLEHFKNTYMIGYPFNDNNYNNFHPTVKYIITVKTGNMSLEKFDGNLGINIVSRNFDTGFIKLDENISLKQKSKNDDADESTRSLFKRNHKDVFQFEDQDIRTISAIILSRDGKGDELLYLEYVDVEIQKAYEKQTFRFPFDGWVRMARQNKKSESLKSRFGKKNSVVVYPNEKPKYEYRIRVSPQISKETEYSIKIDYDIKKQDNINDYKIEFFSELPTSGKLLLCVHGTFGQSELYNFNEDTESIDQENKLTFQVKCHEIGEITQVSLLYEESQAQKFEFNLRTFQITDAEGQSYEIYVDQNLKANREKIIKAKIITYASKSNNLSSDESGHLLIKLESQTEATSAFELKDPIESNEGVVLFKKNEKNLRNIDKVSIKLEDDRYFASIRSLQITGSNGQEFNFKKNQILKSYKEVILRDESKSRSNSNKDESKNSGDLHVQIIGEKKRTELFALKNPRSDGQENLDVFSRVDYDLGRIKNVLVKYNGKTENQIEMNFIEILDPRGNSYKFKTEITLSGGQEIMLPRKKSTENPENSQEILMKEASNLDEAEVNDNTDKPKRPEIKYDPKAEYETKSKTNKPKQEAKKQVKKEQTQVVVKREASMVKKEPSKIDLKRETTKIEVSREHTKIDLNKEPTKTSYSREVTKTQLSREATKIQLSKENSKITTKEKTIVPTSTPELTDDGLIEYEINVRKGAGAFGTPISFKLIGDTGTTEVMRFAPKSGKSLEINKLDQFKMREKDIGKVLKMSLSYEGKELESVWFLSSIEIVKNGESFAFPLERGFTEPETVELEVGKRPPSIEKNMTDMTINSKEMSMLSAAKTPSILGDKKESIKSSSSGKRSNREKSNKSNTSETNEKENE